MAVETAPVTTNQPTATEKLISNLLRTGVFSSAALVVLGTIVTFLRHPSYLSSVEQGRQLRDGLTSFPTTLPAVVQGLTRSEGNAIVMAGLMVLIATPILRVVVSIVAFLQMRDRVFAGITTLVLLLLLTSLSLGRAGG